MGSEGSNAGAATDIVVSLAALTHEVQATRAESRIRGEQTAERLDKLDRRLDSLERVDTQLLGAQRTLADELERHKRTLERFGARLEDVEKQQAENARIRSDQESDMKRALSEHTAATQSAMESASRHIAGVADAIAKRDEHVDALGVKVTKLDEKVEGQLTTVNESLKSIATKLGNPTVRKVLIAAICACAFAGGYVASCKQSQQEHRYQQLHEQPEQHKSKENP